MKKKKNTAEFFPHRDNQPRKQNPLQNSSPTATIDQKNKTHQKKNKTKQNKKTKVRAVPGNCLDIIIGPSGLQLPST